MNIRKLLAPIFASLAIAGPPTSTIALRVLVPAAVVLAGISVPQVAHAEVWTARYGVAETFNFKLYNADGTLDVDESDGGTEVSVSCNEGAETTATNDFVDEGTFYSIALTATEMQCERVAVVVAATTTEVFFIQTIDSTSAMTPAIVQTGDSFARLGAPAGASLAADIVVLDNFVDDLETRLGTPSNLGGGATVAGNLSDIEGQTDDIGALGAGLTAADDAVMTRLGTPAGASVSADIQAVEDQTDDIGVAGVGLTAADDTVMARLGAPAGASMSADIAAVKVDTAAVLDDTGTTGVVIAEATSNCREVLGCDTQGTLSGTHSTTTADLGGSAPTNDISGMTLIIPTHNFSRVIDSYNTGTGVATWVDATAVTLANSNQWYLYATPPGSASGGGLDAAGVRSALGYASASHDTDIAGINTKLGTPAGASLAADLVVIDNFTDDLETRLGTPSNLGGGATVAGNLSDIEGQTDDIGAAGVGLTAADDSVMTRLGTPAGASVSADIAAVEDQTDDIGVAGVGLTAADDTVMARLGAPAGASVSADIAGIESGISWNSAWDAEVQSEADDALRALFLNQLFETTYNPASKPGAVDALLNELVESDAGVARYTANALEQAPTGSGASVSAIADEVQTRTIAGVTLVGTVNALGPNALNAAATAPDFATEINTGQATQTSVDDLPTNSELATAIAAADDAVLAALAALPVDIRDMVVDDANGKSLGCILAALGAYAGGDATLSSTTTTYRDDSGAEIRITGTTATGTRSATITCPAY